MSVLEKSLTGLVAGLSYGLTGFGKSKGEKIDWKKLSISIVVGCTSGVISAFTGWEITVAVQFLASAGITVLIENAVKTLWRRLIKK